MRLRRNPSRHWRRSAPFAPTVRLLLVVSQSLFSPLVNPHRCDSELRPLVRVAAPKRELAIVTPARLRSPVRALTRLVDETRIEGMNEIVRCKGNAKDTPLRCRSCSLRVTTTRDHGLVNGMRKRVCKRDPPFRWAKERRVHPACFRYSLSTSRGESNVAHEGSHGTVRLVHLLSRNCTEAHITSAWDGMHNV